jgi:anaerobic selenocysteine-containing dehydrogenase
VHRITHCPLDCPDACSLRVEVDGDRVVSLDGAPGNPLTAGTICAKVRGFTGHMYGEDRILRPAVRDGAKGEGEFRPVSWDEALDRIATNLRETSTAHGGEAILPFCYGGSNGLLTQDASDARLFRRLGAANLARLVCAAPTTAAAMAMYGKMPGVPLHRYSEARLIIVWGCNPEVSGIHVMPHIDAARRAGARIVVVDPRRTRLARRADMHLAVRPGTDVAVALALAGWLFDNDRADHVFLDRHASGVERFRAAAAHWTPQSAADVAGVEAGDIRTLARWYADAEPAVIRIGWGLERNRNGGSAAAAVLALPAVAGKFGVPAGGYTMSNTGAFPLTTDAVVGSPPSPGRVINMNKLGRELLGGEPKIRSLFVYNSNPVATLPDQGRVVRGLERSDLFTVVFDQVLTDTARYADVVLPATTFLEHAELRFGYGAMVMQYADAVAARVGEARPNYEVFDQIADRLGLLEPGDPRSPEAMTRAILGDERADRLLEERIEILPDGVQFVDIWPRTDDRRAHLFPEALDAASAAGLYGFRPDPATVAQPLALISPATRHSVSSTLSQVGNRPATLLIHPEDAGPRGIDTGAQVRIHNELGQVRCAAQVTRDARPGVVVLPKGLWARQTLNGSTANALVPDALTDFAEGACFNDARVQVEAV